MKVLLIDDDHPAAILLSEALTAQYYTIDVVTDGQVGLELATAWDYDLILLDLLVPKLDGISLCRQLRSQGYQKPILLLTAKDSNTDIVGGLDAGADDYVTKPYDLSELLARIRALLRRRETLLPAVLAWGNLCLDPASAKVTNSSHELSLTPKEYSLLELFLRNPQRIFSRSAIIDRLWSIDVSPTEGAVTNLIKDLRQKLKTAGMTIDLLETVYGLGYRLKAPPSIQERLGDGKIKGQGSKGGNQKGLTSVNKVLDRFKDTFARRVIVLEQIEQALRVGNLSQHLRQSAGQEAHKLTGTLGSFGYETGSKLAQAIEHLLASDKPLESTEVTQLSKLVTELKQELTNPPAQLTTRQAEPALRSAGGSFSGALRAQTPLVLVVNCDLSFAERLRSEAFAWGFRLETASDLVVARQKVAQTPDLVLLDLSWHDSVEDKLTLLQEIRKQIPTVPILVVSERDSLAERVTVSRLGGRGFLPKPIVTTQVFEVITQFLSKPSLEEARVLVVDDDPMMLVALSDLLQPWGLRVTSLQDPSQFWDVLTMTNPNLLIMDLEMPTFSGIDLCQVVRQDPLWGNLPILVVTAYTDIQSIQRVFAAGADDFIGKPVVGPELVTRTLSRIDRSRLKQLGEMQWRIGV